MRWLATSRTLGAEVVLLTASPVDPNPLHRIGGRRTEGCEVREGPQSAKGGLRWERKQGARLWALNAFRVPETCLLRTTQYVYDPLFGIMPSERSSTYVIRARLIRASCVPCVPYMRAHPLVPNACLEPKAYRAKVGGATQSSRIPCSWPASRLCSSPSHPDGSTRVLELVYEVAPKGLGLLILRLSDKRTETSEPCCD